MKYINTINIKKEINIKTGSNARKISNEKISLENGNIKLVPKVVATSNKICDKKAIKEKI
jgi:hypothetical protein